MKELWITIARTGSFQDSEGRPQRFGIADLDALVANYNPQQAEAPLVIGHPATDAPAYGWVQALRREGSILRAQLAHVPEKIRALVAEGRYRYVSMSLSADKKRLRHIGLLGAAQPAIDGLGAVCLAAARGDVRVDFSQKAFADENANTMTGKAMNETDRQAEDAAMPNPEQGDVRLPELGQEESLKLREHLRRLIAELEALRAQNNQLQSQCDLLEQARQDAEQIQQDAEQAFAAYRALIDAQTREERINALISSGRLEPSRKEETMAFAAALASVQLPLSFASATGERQMSAEEHYFRELESRPIAGMLRELVAPAPAHMGRTSGWSEMMSRL